MTLDEQKISELSFQEELIDKPQSFSDHNILAVLDIYDLPKKQRTQNDYVKNELALHLPTDKVLVYVTAHTPSGIKKFKDDYPNAEIRESSILENPTEWRQLGFPEEIISETATPLDSFFAAHHRSLQEEAVLSANRLELEK